MVVNKVSLEECIPPVSLEVENAVLGAILVDPNAIRRVEALLEPDAFYVSANRLIYQAAIDIHREGKAVDLTTVTLRLLDQGKLEAVGGKNRLADLIEVTVSSVNVDLYAQLLNEKLLSRRMIEVGQQLQQLGLDQSKPLVERQAKASEAFAGLSLISTHKLPRSIGEVLINVFDGIEKAASGQAASGYFCGFHDLDAMTLGFKPDNFIVVAGRPAMGKTSFVTAMLRNMAACYQLPTLMFSLEMSPEQLARRLLAQEARIESGRLRAGRIAPDEWEALSAAIDRLSGIPIYFENDCDTVEGIRAKSLELQQSLGKPFAGVAFDYIQQLEGPEEYSVQRMSTITRRLKRLSGEVREVGGGLGCPVFGVSQLSRGVENRTNKRPQMADLRESGSIEQDSDIILGLYRDEYYNSETSDRGIAEVIILKHRDGPVGTVKLLFEPRFTRFQNPDSSIG